MTSIISVTSNLDFTPAIVACVLVALSILVALTARIDFGKRFLTWFLLSLLITPAMTSVLLLWDRWDEPSQGQVKDGDKPLEKERSAKAKKHYDRGASDSEKGYPMNAIQAFFVCGKYVKDYLKGVNDDYFYNGRIR